MAEKKEETAMPFLENCENTVTDEHTDESYDDANSIAPNKTKLANPLAKITEESTNQKSGNQSPVQLGKKTATKIPIMATGLKKNTYISAAKANAIRVGGKDGDGEQPNSRFEGRDELSQNNLLVNTEAQNAEKQDNSVDSQMTEKATNTDGEDVERKMKLLSEENYELRERLLQKDVVIEKLKNEESKAEENIVNKILRKENSELHHEKEELKLERDRLRHLVNEKQGKVEKLAACLKDMEDQLFQTKRALESRTRASTHLEDRLKKINSELDQYREKYGKLEKRNKSTRFSERSRDSRSRSLSPGGRKTSESEQNMTNNHVLMLQQREAKLLDDRSQLEKSVNVLTNKITELERLHKCRSEKRPTHERGNQTDLGICNQLTSTTIQRPNQCNQGRGSGKATQKGDTLKRCRGIVQSLGKFFEEMIQNNQETSAGGSKSRRTSIAARRANELLHELSVSMENALHPESSERESNEVNRSTSPVRRNTAMDTEISRTIWDKLCDEVTKHEFTFDPLSPTSPDEGTSGITSDKEREVKRAERGLEKMNKDKGGANSDNNTKGFTKEDATRMMNVSRKQTESVVKEMLTKHQGEIRALLENACQSSPIPTVAFDISSPDGSGQNEATMAVKELDCFKTRTTRVQSLILKMQEIVEFAQKEKHNAEQKLQSLAEDLRKKDTLLEAKSLELRRRHGRTLEAEKALHVQINAMKDEKASILEENARLHELCRQKDLQVLQKVQEIKTIQQRVNQRDAAHDQTLAKMRKSVQEAWGLYESVKSRAEKRTAEFSEAAEKLKVSQGYLLDLWQTLKTVDNVVEANEHDEL